ncbi:MAG: hypothetical protein CVU98_09350 [Firmicutes bacterium HGW-Firmicutes-3]|nr:MAG: hypothetical protein CVU98_09350 [Firmicutes bacterium HGW-Firmicutes-3]
MLNHTNNLYNLAFYFFIYGFLGWLVEVIYAFVKHGKFVNRGFLYGPICPIYGVGVVTIYLSIHRLSTMFLGGQAPTWWMLFIMVTVVTTGLELFTGAFMSYLFRTRWWDYSDRRFNLRGYICLDFTLIWGLAGTLLLQIVHIRIANLVEGIPRNIGNPLLLVLMAFFIIDSTSTVRTLIDFRKLLLEMDNIAKQYVQIRSNLVMEMSRLKDELTDRVEKKTDEAGQTLKRIQEQLKELQVHEFIPNHPVKNIINELIDEDMRLNIKTKFEFKSVLEHYENLSNRFSKSRLYNAFPDMKSIKYKALLKDVRDRKKNKGN